MAKLAVIGGTGAALFPGQAQGESLQLAGNWGEPSAPVCRWQQRGHELLFLPRHGPDGLIPPHAVNYRANMQLLKDLGADFVVALNAVGGIAAATSPGRLVIPDQLIDYTWGRRHSYFDGNNTSIEFIDFTKPYDDYLRDNLVISAGQKGLAALPAATYGVTQGPRLETAAEIDRLERDGCHVVGMTAMPEAALARELKLPYASCCIVVNRAAGRSDTAIHAEIEANLRAGMEQVAGLIDTLLQNI